MKVESIAITGVWLRSLTPDRIMVLLEIDGKWRLVINKIHTKGGVISHIVEPLGIIKSPVDYLEGKAQ